MASSDRPSEAYFADYVELGWDSVRFSKPVGSSIGQGGIEWNCEPKESNRIGKRSSLLRCRRYEPRR